uniref:Rap-GAP domain-containing protein n=1 Tax=Phytophthora ramorum TaxID=164328 RepID=H3GR43_PHYRM
MDTSKRVADAKAPRKEAPSAEMKRLAKFFAPDRPPRKRLRTLLDFLKGSEASAGGNIAVAVQSLLSGASKDVSASNVGPEHAAAVADFWADASNSALVFGVVNDCVTELETLYAPHETAFRKQRRKPLEAEDWSEVFEGLEVLLRNNAARLREGWNNNGVSMLFAKLLKRDNHAMIKKYAFRCLALYTDATRNLQQLAAMPSTSTSSFQASRTGSIRLMSDGIEIDIDEDDEEGRGTAMLSHAMPNRKNMHLELLRESVDFSPYGGGSIMLPDKFLNEGVHVEGWMRPMPTQAEEPVDMLKFLMDLSLEREDPHGKLSATGKPSGNSDRFVFWAELIMKFYMPLLYPKICLKVKLKEEGDTLGFFHHCPGSFQRVVARWVYKLRSKEDFMEVLWSRREFSEVIMETIRQRFAYRDTELVVDAIKFYSGICTGAHHLTILARVLFKGITSPSGVVVSTVLQKSSVLFSLNLEGLNILVPAYLYAVDEIIIGNIWSRAEKSKVKSSEWNNELNAALDVVFAILELPKRFPDQDFVRWKQKIQGVCGIDELALMQGIIDEIPETLDEFHVIIGRILVRIAQLPFTDVVDIKKRALWGLYCLVVMNLRPNKDGEHVVDPIHLAEWIVHLVDVCQNVDFSISMAALTILQDMSDYHEEINAFEPSLVARIVMTLAVFAQQQVEEASIEVQAAMERMGAAESADGDHGSGTKSASFTGSSLTSGSRISGSTSAARRGSDNPRSSRVESSVASNPAEATDPFSKLKSKLKPGAPNAPASAPSPSTNSPDTAPATSIAAKKEQDIPALRLIVQKTSAIFECLRFWIMHRTEVLQDVDVKKLIFSAIEAALVGTLPDELNELDAVRDSGDDESPPAALSFVFMDSIVFSVVGSLDSPCARFIVRDMTGLFTWEITPAIMARDTHSLTSWVGPGPKLVNKNSGGAPAERELTLETDMVSSDSLALHQPNCAVQVGFKHTDDVGGICKTCGGEKPRTKAAPSDAKGGRGNATTGIKLEARQASWEQERDILSNNICPIKSSYVFHEDGSSASGSSSKENGDSKKKDKSRSSEIEKMPGSGNKDERQERLERIAKQHEERNNTGSLAQPVPEPQKVVCHCPPQTASKFKRRTTTTICGLFDMSINEPNVGSLDDERCLLDLVLDSIPMVFRDCGGDTTDKTLFGGRYSMMRYNLMDLTPSTNPLLLDSAEAPGFSFLQRLIHDEECYSQLKNFLAKDDNAEGKELVEFCDAVKKYERSSVPTDRLGQASVIYWEFLTVEGGKKIVFPTAVVSDIQTQIHKAQSALRASAAGPAEDSSEPSFCLPGSLFQHAMSFVEYEGFEKSGLLDKYVAALDQPPAASSTSASNGKSNSSTPSIPPQLALFDSFSIMEVNARVSHLALQKRNADEQLVRMTKPGVAAAERLIKTTNGNLKDSRVSALDICRLFLSQAGLLPSPDGDSNKKSTLKLLEHGPKLERSLKHLDKSPTRETMKLGVIYVGKKQHTQQEILHNEKGSRAYELFLSQLGWKVEMQSHRGFPSDPQQIDKKRHVGNDYVHIVWSDNATHVYDPSTITSHFNDVQIVIYPLRKAQRGLFLIKIHTKDKVPPFGPLQSGMVVHQADLARLVRQTAMNANRVCRSQTMLYVRPYPTRKKLVDEIVERYAGEYKESQLLTMLFGNSASTPASVPTSSVGAD